MSPTHLTVGQVASIFGAPTWRVRRVVDALDSAVPRAGQYRLIPRTMLADIGAKLQQPQPVVESS
jgi:hypothetical protein